MRGGYRRGKAMKPVINTMAPSIYLLRDQFLTDYAAGTMDGTPSEPIVGRRQVVDTENKIFILTDRLRGGGQVTPVWGDSKMVWTNAQGSGFARAAGRTMAGLLVPEDTVTQGDIALGWATATNIVDPRTDGLGYLEELAGQLGVIVPGKNLKLRGTTNYNVRAMQQLIGITLNDVGAVIWISTFGTATPAVGGGVNFPIIPKYPLASILWVDNTDATATLFPYIQYFGVVTSGAYPNGNSLEDLRVLDVSAWAAPDAIAAFADRFTRADSNTTVGNGWVADPTGTWGISGNQAYYVARISGSQHFVIHDTGLADGNGYYMWDWTCPTVGTPWFYLYFRYQDTSNYYKVHNSAGNNIYLTRVIGGVPTDMYSNPLVWTPGQTYKIKVVSNGNYLAVFVDNVIKYNVSTANNNLLPNTTKFGFGEDFAPKTGERWDNMAAYPLQITLPAIIGDGKVPTILTGGTILAQDSFTGINGTDLTAHVPEVGPAWVSDNTVWQIQGNKADPIIDVNNYTQLTQDLGVTDCEIQAEIYIANDNTVYHYGLVGRYVDNTHWIGPRIAFINNLFQEIEFITNNAETGGIATVAHKIELSYYYVTGSTHTFKAQYKGDLVQVFLDGEPVISYYTTATDPMGTKFGFHADKLVRTIEGGTFDNWIVRAL